MVVEMIQNSSEALIKCRNFLIHLRMYACAIDVSCPARHTHGVEPRGGDHYHVLLRALCTLTQNVHGAIRCRLAHSPSQ